MKGQVRKYIIAFTLIGDLFLINFLIRYFWLEDARLVLGGIWPFVLILSSIAWMVLAWLFKLNPLPRIKERKKLIRNTTGAGLILIFLTLLAHISINRNISLSLDFLYFCLGLLGALVTWNFFIDMIMSGLRTLGYDTTNVLIAGFDKQSNQVREFIDANPWTGYRFRGYVYENTPEGASTADTDLAALIQENNIGDIFLNLTLLRQDQRKEIQDIAFDYHLNITLIPDLHHFLSFHHTYQRFDLLPLIAVGNGPFAFGINRFSKRLFDIIFSLFFLLSFFSWFAIIAGIVIKLSSKGPVFFRQKRTGYHNSPFTMLKFRTMRLSKDAHTRQASRDDPRLTTFGRLLRRTNLDELPQLLNVLLGQMSLVGPRPHMLEHTKAYADIVHKYLYRHYVRPGMSGLAQIKGYRGETPELSDMEGRIQQDIFYIENWTFWLDIKILWLTFVKMLRGDEKAY